MSIKIRTWGEPPFEIPGVKPLVKVRLNNVPSADPIWAAEETARYYAELGLDPEDYYVYLWRYGGVFQSHKRLNFKEVLCDMTEWNVPNDTRDAEAIAFWSDWTDKYLQRMDELDQNPRGFVFDSERPIIEQHRMAYAMEQSFYSKARAKWEGIELGNWEEFGEVSEGTFQSPVMYWEDRRNLGSLNACLNNKPIIPWLVKPLTSPFHDHWYFLRNLGAAAKQGTTEFTIWGAQTDESWRALADCMEVVQAIEGVS